MIAVSGLNRRSARGEWRAPWLKAHLDVLPVDIVPRLKLALRFSQIDYDLRRWQKARQGQQLDSVRSFVRLPAGPDSHWLQDEARSTMNGVECRHHLGKADLAEVASTIVSLLRGSL